MLRTRRFGSGQETFDLGNDCGLQATSSAPLASVNASCVNVLFVVVGKVNCFNDIKPWSSLVVVVVRDEGWIGPIKQLLCLS